MCLHYRTISFFPPAHCYFFEGFSKTEKRASKQGEIEKEIKTKRERKRERERERESERV